MARLPYPEHRNPEEKKGRETLNILKLLSYSPTTIQHWSNIGQAHFTQLELSTKNRELVILFTTARFRSSYEWDHHAVISKRVGISDAQKEELSLSTQENQTGFFRDGKSTAGFNKNELLLLSFVEDVIEKGEVSDELFQKMRETFSDRQIVEVLSIQGFYYTFSRMTTVLKVDMEHAGKPKL